MDSLYLATVNRSGDFRLLHQGAHGRKVICEAKLALDDLLLQRDRRSVPLIDAGNRDRLPAIFYEDPFPLLIPCNQFNGRRSWIGTRIWRLRDRAGSATALVEHTRTRTRADHYHVPGKALLVLG